MKVFSWRTLGTSLAACVVCWSGPVLRAEIIADSVAEFSGVQGQENWWYGYRNVTADMKGTNYDAFADFISLTNWTGSAWDLNLASGAPWTVLGQTNVHPNGVNSGGNEHWVVRRWTAEELTAETPLAITWNTRKDSVGGNGVTGAIYTNGTRADFATIAGNNTNGVTRTYYFNAQFGDVIDLILSPVGTDGQGGDGSDGSVHWMRIDTTIPAVPWQPDGTVFIPIGAPDTDADGLPDVWEIAYTTNDLTKLTATGDFDADGLADSAEFARSTNPVLTDTDNDGLVDGVETGTGVFVGANDTGTDPRKADTDGDGRTDGAEVNGPIISNPLLTDTDGDTFGDGVEVASGHNPNDGTHNPTTTPIAKSDDEFSGVQGANGWYSGYRNFSADGQGANYDPTNHFILFPGGQGLGAWNSTTQLWTGSQWDMNTAEAGPWTELGRRNTHPNGPSPVHWSIRRWIGNELTNVTPLALRYFTRKSNTGCGNGVTAGVFINGVRGDSVAVAYNNGTGVTRTYYVNANPGDIIDLILSPTGADGQNADGCDGSENYLWIDPVLPARAVQPDGSVFVPANAGDTDADGLADAWEEIYFPGDLTKLSATGDFDADGLSDAGERTRGSDPTKSDTDSDGLGDAVETATGTFVSATDTGSDPTKSDTDGDGRADADEVNGTPATNPNLADSDGDGFSDPAEIAAGTNPNDRNDNVLSFVIANSVAEFSGVQGSNNWFFGYRDYTADGGGVNYDPTNEFVLFQGGAGVGPWDPVTNHWNGGSWDLNTAAAGPWTWIAPEELHPNGPNSGNEHWAIRRWIANEVTSTTPVGFIWQVRKISSGGSGVTGAIYVNGQLVDSKSIPGTETSNAVRRFYFNLNPGDIVDLVHTPVGPSGDHHDGADGSVEWMWVDTRLPAIPRQPDGTLFIPFGAPDTDGDGLPDVWEYSYFAGDLTKLTATGDFDNDGLTDTQEMSRSTNPGQADTDSDGLRDGVETGTGIFVDANNTGTDPRKADTDNDGRMDGEEVTGPITTNPILADTDGDTFSDGSEVASGHNPNDPNNNPNTTKLADSKAEFSGTQGQNDWFFGYRDLNADGGGTYDVTNFVEFPAAAFINNSWDLAVDVAPWTLVASEETHPAGPDPLHWAIRRWVATEVTNTTPLALRYFLRKSNAGCGNGVTGSVLVNGQELDNVIIAYNNGTGVTRTYYANINPGDVIDFAIKSAGTHIEDNSIHNDWCDGTAAWLVVDSAVPANATQPDGTPFVPVGTPEFTDITVSNATGQVTIKWNSIAGATYKIDATSDLKNWTSLATGLASAGAETTYTETLPAQRPATRFYRVARE